jgi:hypothetical protein
MRALMLWGVSVVVALALVVSAAGATSGQVACPIHSGAVPTTGDVQWDFTDSGRPNGTAVKSSYVHGHGTWTNGRASGTGCTMDALKKVTGVRDLVLTIAGKSKLTGQVEQGGLPGVRIILPVKVRATDDKACAKGATGTITLFASYYGVHVDTMRIRFGRHCTGHSLSYSGSTVHVYIARHGHQVNTP